MEHTNQFFTVAEMQPDRGFFEEIQVLRLKAIGAFFVGREAAGKFGDDSPRSVADITDPTSLGKVREWKKAAKAAKKDKQDRPVG